MEIFAEEGLSETFDRATTMHDEVTAKAHTTRSTSQKAPTNLKREVDTNTGGRPFPHTGYLPQD